MKKNLTYEEARRYIAGEDFDPIEWEKQHILRLTESINAASITVKPIYYDNLRKTAEHYIQIHINTPHKKELQGLIAAYLSIGRETP